MRTVESALPAAMCRRMGWGPRSGEPKRQGSGGWCWDPGTQCGLTKEPLADGLKVPEWPMDSGASLPLEAGLGAGISDGFCWRPEVGVWECRWGWQGWWVIAGWPFQGWMCSWWLVGQRGSGPLGWPQGLGVDQAMGWAQQTAKRGRQHHCGCWREVADWRGYWQSWCEFPQESMEPLSRQRGLWWPVVGEGRLVKRWWPAFVFGLGNRGFRWVRYPEAAREGMGWWRGAGSVAPEGWTRGTTFNPRCSVCTVLPLGLEIGGMCSWKQPCSVHHHSSMAARIPVQQSGIKPCYSRGAGQILATLGQCCKEKEKDKVEAEHLAEGYHSKVSVAAAWTSFGRGFPRSVFPKWVEVLPANRFSKCALYAGRKSHQSNFFGSASFLV